MATTGTANTKQIFDLSGGRLCLDFVNTISRARPTERLASYADLVAWGKQAGVLTESEARRLSQAARRRPEDASATLAGALRLREALFRIFSSSFERRTPDPGDMEILNVALRTSQSRLQLESVTGGFGWTWAGEDDSLDRVLWPIARSTAELLTSSDRDRIRRCAGANCAWMFLDLSRNHSRRWCDMTSCGNRAKARRYYTRHKAD
jgi:predicted RNA-binding Zn ribbon-like protein